MRRPTTITWKENDGPPVEPPTKEGLGTKLLDRGIPSASVIRLFEADGFKCVITLARSAVTTGSLATSPEAALSRHAEALLVYVCFKSWLCENARTHDRDRSLIPTARRPGWLSNRGLSKLRWLTLIGNSVPPNNGRL
jgi:hypothetical protein